MSARTLVLLLAAGCLPISNHAAVAQRPSLPFIWPLSRASQPLAPIVSTFGPRMSQHVDGDYSFHRGIDIPAEKGTPVYAIAGGVVRLAGLYEYYQTPVVQLRHYKTRSGSCDDGGCFYSNYMHLSEVYVKEGKTVRQGELLGYTGANPEGLAHLHLEIRDEGVYQRNCIHPLTVLPYINRWAPKIQCDTLAADEQGKGTLNVTVQTPRNECDLRSVSVMISSSARNKTTVSYDMVQWNLTQSPNEDPNRFLQFQDVNNVIAQPKPIVDQEDYELHLIFYNLPNVKVEGTYQVKVEATDARGKSSSVTRRLRAVKPDTAPAASRIVQIQNGVRPAASERMLLRPKLLTSSAT